MNADPSQTVTGRTKKMQPLSCPALPARLPFPASTLSRIPHRRLHSLTCTILQPSDPATAPDRMAASVTASIPIA
jgi:hypothetical protein